MISNLISELGGAYGNSTCAMAVAAKMLRPQPCRIVSLCQSDLFKRVSQPYLESYLPDPSILAAVEPLEADILTYDLSPRLPRLSAFSSSGMRMAMMLRPLY
jgi:hypothetical protein